MIIKKNENKLVQILIQFFKFGLVGGINTLVSLAIYYLLVYLNTNFMVATVIGYIASSICGYLLNRIWVFQAQKTKIVKSALRYYIIYGASFLINMSCMYLFVNILAISKYVAPVLTMCITIPFNYIFSRIWIYK